MSLKIIEESQKACFAKKMDNKKNRRALERGNKLLVDNVIGQKSSKNIPKNRRNERFIIRDRLAKKLSERNENDAELIFVPLSELPPELQIESEIIFRDLIRIKINIIGGN